MNRGSPLPAEGSLGRLESSMRPRFMNRGSVELSAPGARFRANLQ